MRAALHHHLTGVGLIGPDDGFDAHLIDIEIGLVADDDGRCRLVDRGDIPLRTAAGKTDPAALSQRHHLDRGNLAEHRSGSVDDGALAERDARPEERLAAAGLRDEAHVLAVGFCGSAQTERRSTIADLCLGEMADGKQGPSEFALRQHVHDVALILGGIRATMHEVAIADRLDTGMVASGDRIESEEIGTLTEAVELQVAIALDARIWRAALAVGTHVRVDDMRIEVVGEVEDEVIDVELLGNAPGVVDIRDRATTRIAVAAP